ncbi:dihydrodipicolinate reductase C-terminal domain-containing protein [Balneola sp. MJW-20]|uniref:dihydrodipicolinate reductase C-terminal domain-containing protein n=1 Tax=Gracilimonas aurantiaca TaxID=3234185 RepID=UPI0034666F99
MKISVIGTGKTGSRVVELLGSNLDQTFDENNPPTADKLKGSDGVIIFVPGSAVPDILDAVIESGIPAAWGSTGYEWPDDLSSRVSTKWVIASNFSLGMNIIRKCIQMISKGSSVLQEPEFRIHEIHHIHKKDAPSGTALSWKDWLGKDAEVSSEREGDIKGIHELTVETGTERITLNHTALDRALFAEGAIWAIEQLIHNKELQQGVYDFGALFDKLMEEKK